jgi:hypothetical protein
LQIKNIELVVEKASTLDIPSVGVDHDEDAYFGAEEGKLKWRNGNFEKLITHYDLLTSGDAILSRQSAIDRRLTESNAYKLFSGDD